MTIQRGGKFPSNPHGTPAAADENGRPRRAAEKRQAQQAADVGAQDATGAAATDRETTDRVAVGDAYVTGRRAGPNHGVTAATLARQQEGTLTGVRLDELLSDPAQARDLEQSLEAHATKLSREFESLRSDAQQLVGRLAQSGFSPAAVDAARGQLADVRRNMASLRGRISADHRRLRALHAAAQRAPESRMADKVAQQLRRVSDMERGWGRAFLALGLAGTYSHLPPEGEARVARVSVDNVPDAQRHPLATHLAQQSPGAAASQLMVALLEGGPQAPSGRLVADAYAELHTDLLAGRFGKSLQGLGLWRQALG